MAKYYVQLEEHSVYEIEVEANSEEEAKEKGYREFIDNDGSYFKESWVDSIYAQEAKDEN